MRMVTRVDAETDEMLLWCGGEDFDIIQAQKELNNAGMSLQEVRNDKWATVGPVETPEVEENGDGRG
jgi:hypothetical protein